MAFWNKLGRRKGQLDDSVAMRMVIGDKTRDITFKELCLSNKISFEALAGILIKKGVITPHELLAEINAIRDESANAAQKIKAKNDEQSDEKRSV